MLHICMLNMSENYNLHLVYKTNLTDFYSSLQRIDAFGFH